MSNKTESEILNSALSKINNDYYVKYIMTESCSESNLYAGLILNNLPSNISFEEILCLERHIVFHEDPRKTYNSIIMPSLL